MLFTDGPAKERDTMTEPNARIPLQKKEDRLKHFARTQAAELASYMEILLALLILAAMLASFVPLCSELWTLYGADSSQAFEVFLSHAFNLVIGIEFIKMLTKHTPGSALEVLLYAIARHMVLGTDNGAEQLLGVLAIALIFAIRRFIFVPAFGATMPDGKPAPDVSCPAAPEEGPAPESVF